MDTQGVYKKRSKGKTVREYAKIPTAPTHHSNLYSTVLERAHE